MRVLCLLGLLASVALAQPADTVRQRAYEINHSGIAGCFEELGAQPWTSGEFFQAGGASGTILAASSHYGKGASNDAYGPPPGKRFVARDRLVQILDHLFADCLRYAHAPGQELPAATRLFAFADTVATTHTGTGGGWMGLRYRLKPEGETDEIVMKLKLLGNGPAEQARDLGRLGVNLIYAAYHPTPVAEFLKTLATEVNSEGHRGIAIEELTMNGPDLPKTSDLKAELAKAGWTP